MLYCLFKPCGRSSGVGFSHNLAKRLAIFPMLLFLLSSNNARSRVERLDGSSNSMLGDLSEVPCTSPDVAVFSSDILGRNSSSCQKKFLVSLKLDLPFFPGT